MHEPGKTIKPLVRLGRSPDDCWAWLGKTTPAGYPRKFWMGREVNARRWLWEVMFGPLAEDLVVSPSCGDSGCMNPHHFRAVRFIDARRDSIQTTLTPADVAEIKRAKKGKTQHTANLLAARFGVTPVTIREIWRGRTWRRIKTTPAATDGGELSSAA